MSYIGNVGDSNTSINSDFSKYTYEYIATAGQTTFTGTDINSAVLGYTVGNIIVSYGGADLAFSDYTATNGTSVVLADGALVGKILRVVAFEAFELADAYTKTQIDANTYTKTQIDANTYTQSQADTLLAAKATVANFTSTGIDDNATSNAITIDANENVGVGATSLSNHTNFGHITAGGSSGGMVTNQVNGTDGMRLYSTAAGTILNETRNLPLDFNTNNTARMRIDSAGIVTKPYQPAFLVGSSGITNLAVNAYVTVPWNVSEIFDIGSNFASNRFTAPVTGKYQLAVSLRVENLDSASQYYILQFTTSNRTYRIIFDPDFGQDSAFWDFGLSTLADMDAGDTATVEIHQASGTAQTDINASANWSFFSGYLVC